MQSSVLIWLVSAVKYSFIYVIEIQLQGRFVYDPS